MTTTPPSRGADFVVLNLHETDSVPSECLRLLCRTDLVGVGVGVGVGDRPAAVSIRPQNV